MRYIACFIICYILACLTAQAQDDHFQVLCELKTGYSTMRTAAFRQWAKTENIPNATGRADNIQTGFAFGVAWKKAVFNMSFDLSIGSQRFIRPRTNIWFLGGGYQILNSRYIDINLLGNIGIGDIIARFRKNQPASFASLPHSGEQAFARSLILVGQPVVCFHLKFPNKEDDEDNPMRLMCSLKVGFDAPLINGNWRYGQNYNTRGSSYNGGSTTVFQGNTVNIPNFYKGAFFIQFGIGFLLESN